MNKLRLSLIILACLVSADAFAQRNGGGTVAGPQLASHPSILNSGSSFLGRQLNHAVTTPRQDAKPKIERDAKK
jgi:hypothetical protein